MSRADRIRALTGRFGGSVPVYAQKKIFGLIPVKRQTGYLWIDDEADRFNVSTADGKTSSYSPVYSVNFRKDNGERATGPGDLTGGYKTAVTLWPVRDLKVVIKISDEIGAKVDQAYDFHFSQAA